MTTITEKEVSQLRNHAKIGIKISKKVKELKEQIEELKQENEELKEENQKLLLKSLYREIRVDKLILEKKELKEKITMQSHDEDFMNHEMKIIWDENVKLIEELKLKDEIIKLHETS